MSDFMGCMTGLPYIGLDIKDVIQQIETTTLYNIYKQLYLAVTWERATVSVQYSTYDDGFGTTYYHVTGLTLVDSGGGYGREGTAAPVITISNGGSGTTTIGTDDTIVPGNFGRVITVALSSAGSDGTSIPTATVDFPPGTGSFSNSIVQTYIDAANTEIALIQTNNTTSANQLNNDWAKSGTQLTIEQRAISTGLPVQVPLAAPIDKVTDLAQFPTTQIAFVDSIPQFAVDTKPHMIAQSLEAVSNLCTPGGESIVGLMRESRNKSRLAAVGVPLDSNIPATLSPTQNKELVANGSVLGSSPAKLEQVTCPAGDNISPVANGYYNPNDDRYYSDGRAIDIGEAIEPGSFAGSRYQNLIPAELSVIYTSDILLPSTYSVQEAIDEVIRCNCDCWDNI
jgi:hypothetical protein